MFDTNELGARFIFSQSEGLELLWFCNELTPATACAIIRVIFENKDKGCVEMTTLIATTEPLVPLKFKTDNVVS